MREEPGVRIECIRCGIVLWERGPEPGKAAKTVGTCCAGVLGLSQAQAFRPPRDPGVAAD